VRRAVIGGTVRADIHKGPTSTTQVIGGPFTVNAGAISLATGTVISSVNITTTEPNAIVTAVACGSYRTLAGASLSIALQIDGGTVDSYNVPASAWGNRTLTGYKQFPIVGIYTCRVIITASVGATYRLNAGLGASEVYIR